MAKAQIKLSDGISVSVEGTPDEIASVVARLKGQTQQGPHSRRGTKPTAMGGESTVKNRKVQLPDLIANLIDGGFFKKPKDLAAVKVALEEMGHHYPVTSLSGAMLREVRKRGLRRLKQDKRWMYTG